MANFSSNQVKNLSAQQEKSISPAVLGITSSHGVKLKLNATSQDKKELLSKLEEWRKARKQKLAASILSKRKPTEKPSMPTPVVPLKNKPNYSGPSDLCAQKSQEKETVFERLYKNSGRVSRFRKSDDSLKFPQMISSKSVRKSVVYKSENKVSDKVTPTSENQKNMAVNSQCPPEKSQDMPCGSDKSISALLNVSQVTETDDCKMGKFRIKNELNLVQENLKETEVKLEKSISDDPKKILKVPLRRSISMVYRNKCKSAEIPIYRTTSENNLQKLGLNNETERKFIPTLSPVLQEKIKTDTKSKSFVTPDKQNSLSSSHLRSKLEDWLKKKGHSSEGYKHLRCFGLSSNLKSTPSVNVSSRASCTIEPRTPADDSDKENMTPSSEQVVREKVDVTHVEIWLKELHRLILELKYPSERCEEWLTAIRKACISCTQLPVYWECLAALDESKGDMKSAIECYETAIIKGAEVDSVGDSLAQLFDKMVMEQQRPSKAKLEKGLDPKNIFKSTIIKFSLQQKAVKELGPKLGEDIPQQLFVATPVRRSSRIRATSPCKTRVVDSLRSLSPEVRSNMTFKPNESLLSRE